MVGLDRPVELPPIHRRHHLVIETEVVQQHGPRQRDRPVVGDRQLHLREQVARPALRHQEGSALEGCGRGELRCIDEPDPLRHRIDAERRPRHVEERERRHDRHLHPGVGAQQLDGTLGHERRARHGVDNRFGRGRFGRNHQPFDDGRVHLLERAGRVVDVVAAGRAFERRRRRMPGRAQPNMRRGTKERHRADPHEIAAGGPEAHHDKVGAVSHAQPLKGLFETGSAASLAGAFRTSDVAGVNGVKTAELPETHLP